MAGIRSSNKRYCSFCNGRDGRPKRAYQSASEAAETVVHVFRTRGVALRVYECERSWSWHLTSDLNGGW